MIKFFLGLLIILTFLGCTTRENIILSESISVILGKKSEISDNEIVKWHFKDIFEDTIPGISLDKAYRELLKNKEGKEVVVAIIDTEVDINHEDLKDQIWINTQEIPNNNKDDDDNGYIDDINGWNFLGNSEGGNVIHSNYESVRIIRKFNSVFDNKSIDNIPSDQKENFKIYQKAQTSLKETLETNENRLERIKTILEEHRSAQKKLKSHFSIDSITKEQLINFKTEDTIIEKHRKKLLSHLESGYSEKILQDYTIQIEGSLSLSANLEYNERDIINDDPNDITDIDYGNNNVAGNLEELYHGTLVAGVLAAKRNNDIGADGIYDKIKIMPLCVSSNGDELDKDIALAIRYAVDNGAKVINMSSGKPFSMNRNWVNEAIKYAEKENVLFVTSAGNDQLNLDDEDANYYPNDTDVDNLEISNNFIMVGANSYTLDKKLRYYLTNYGKNNVDLFAPGYKVYTTSPHNKYRYTHGTSVATPIVAGVAALLLSHYPSLKASQVKEIIMKSGVSYNINVEMFEKDGSRKMIPFSELSKSGKVVNAYNALLMAKQVSQSKNLL